MFLVFFFQANLKADNKEAKNYHRKAERYIKKKEVKNAVEMMENAIMIFILGIYTSTKQRTEKKPLNTLSRQNLRGIRLHYYTAEKVCVIFI